MFSSASGSRGMISPVEWSFNSLLLLLFVLCFLNCLCPSAAVPKSGKGARKIDISKITPPASPPSRTFDLSPPHSDPKGKRKEDDVEVEQVREDVVAGAGGGEARAKIVRVWQLMGEDTLEFEATMKELADEREKFNAEKKGLLWRVSNAEDKLAKEKQFNANKQKE
ncbi:hypothetical protein Hdeb2414_s0037g00732861 [Helianthus debilis subsp. tardiflorus]